MTPVGLRHRHDGHEGAGAGVRGRAAPRGRRAGRDGRRGNAGDPWLSADVDRDGGRVSSREGRTASLSEPRDRGQAITAMSQALECYLLAEYQRRARGRRDRHRRQRRHGA